MEESILEKYFESIVVSDVMRGDIEMEVTHDNDIKLWDINDFQLQKKTLKRFSVLVGRFYFDIFSSVYLSLRRLHSTIMGKIPE